MVLEWLAEVNHLQFEFAARCSEICPFKWDWVDFEKRCVVWLESNTGGIFKPMNLDFIGWLEFEGFEGLD